MTSLRRYRTVSPDQAMRALSPGERVVASPFCATPETLLAALGRRAGEVDGLTLAAGPMLGTHPYSDAVRAGRLRLQSWQIAGAARHLARDGLVDYLPARSGDLGPVLDRGIDTVLVRVGPPDHAGACSLGPSLSYTRAAVERATTVIAEIDPSFPTTCGRDAYLVLEEITTLVETDTETCIYPRAEAGEQARRVAEHIIELLPHRSSLQLGIGAVPEAVAECLGPRELARVRMIGLTNDAMIPVLEANRGADVPLIKAVEVLGGPELFAAVHRNRALWMASSRVIHNPTWLTAQPRLVSICSALQVDLSGQVASEELDGSLLAGIGGSADFIAGAGGSEGGLRVVALPATTPRGQSRIVSALSPGTPVTVPRHSIDVVVTEYGAAWLRGRSLTERAVALTAIAAPDHQPDLDASLAWSA